MKPLTTSCYTFPDLIDGGYLYVDKTSLIHELIKEAKGQYFLARPRRFGKSLLVSTLRAIFEGRRELFDGLALAGMDYDWQTSPVIHLDLGAARARSDDELEASLLRRVHKCAAENGCAVGSDNCYDAFEDLITELATRDGKLAILVDEYDKPLLGHLGKESASAIQAVLKSFYSVIKSTEAYQRFVLLTGVSKFSKVSVFSDLNNLTDLTMRGSEATLLGYTQSELEANFPDYIERLAAHGGTSVEQTLADLRDWYDGYRFHYAAEPVYNPVSTMKCFQEQEYKNYWFETGTPTFLIALLRNRPVDLGDMSVPETAFSAYEPDRLEPLPLLVQTGYLTLQGTEDLGGLTYYRLGYPNREIEQSFSMWLARGFSQVPAEELGGALRHIVNALNEGRVEDMLKHLKIFFANIPNDITLKHEKYYQTVFFTVFKLIGAAVEAETRTNIGRIDAVIKTGTDIFIFEFKLHGTAREALDQIRETRYAEPYLDDGRRITLIGAAFDPEERNLCDVLVEPLPAGREPPCSR